MADLDNATKLKLESILRWSRLGESNPGPTHYECVALTD